MEEGLIRITPDFAIFPSPMRDGVYIHLKKDGKPLESFYLNIQVEDIINELKKTDWYE